MGSMPGLGGVLAAGEADSPAIGGAAPELSGASGAALSGPLVAHIVDVSSGEINLYQGATQIVARSPALAQALARLATAQS
jgi:hypothetical protein